MNLQEVLGLIVVMFGGAAVLCAFVCALTPNSRKTRK
jgi:hypothetical protein